MRSLHRVPGICLALAAALLLSAGAAFARSYSASYEARIGKEAIDQVKKEYKVYDDPAQLARVQTIIDALKAASPRPDVKYQIFLLDTEEENAFSIPGGYICVTKKLLTNIQSDDQLAGVLAHEMAHNCTYDALEEANQSQKLTIPILAAVVAALATGRPQRDRREYLHHRHVPRPGSPVALLDQSGVERRHSRRRLHGQVGQVQPRGAADLHGASGRPGAQPALADSDKRHHRPDPPRLGEARPGD